jgi:hypothetical protein
LLPKDIRATISVYDQRVGGKLEGDSKMPTISEVMITVVKKSEKTRAKEIN